jgi:hypothetical protein
MDMKHKKCLVLNADYTPLTIIGWQRAILWSIKYENKSNSYSNCIIDFYKNDYICGVNNKKIPIPAVLRLSKYIRVNPCSIHFSRKNLFTRDNFMCQYCGSNKDVSELTYDHVIPKSCWNRDNGSPTNWYNVVTACVYCNRKKGNKTPSQANMKLLNLPTRPHKNVQGLTLAGLLNNIKHDIPEEWKIYLPQSYLQTK